MSAAPAGRRTPCEPSPWRRHFARHLARRADRARERGKYAAAASLYRRALALDPNSVGIRVQLGHMLKELTRFGEAEAAYRQALAQAPDDGEIYLQLGHLLKLLGRIEEARAAYAGACRLLPDDAPAAAELQALGTPAAAAAGDPPSGSVAERHIDEGDRLRDAGRYEEAAGAYAAALRLLPMRTDIRIQHGNMLKDAGRLAAAEAAYCAALANAPEEGEIHLQLGHVFKLQGRGDEAVASYRRAVELRPALDAAWAELFHRGSAQDQQRSFERQLAQGGTEALLAVTGEVHRLQGAVTRLAETLPDLAGQMAFPVASYDRFRSLFDVPLPPPAATDRSFGVVLTAHGVPLDTLYAQIAALSGQTWRNWRLEVVGTDAAQRRVVERAAASDQRIAWAAAAADETAAAAERRAAIAQAADWLVLPARGALLHRHALGWCAAIVGQGAAKAFVTDEEAVTARDGMPRRSDPQLRQVVDYDTLLEANPFGETIIVEHAAYAAVTEKIAAGSLSAARSALLLALAQRGTVGHIPLPLVAVDAGAARAADPGDVAVHETVVRAHLDAFGLADRVALGPAHGGDLPLPILWQPAAPQRPIEVIVPTRDNAGDVRDVVASLRRHAATPEALSILIVDNGSERAESVRILDELCTEERVRVVRIDEPFNWSRLNNRAVALSRATLLVFANDDMLMLSDGWDRQLRGVLERPDIGAVGARLVYPDDSVQHAAILLGWPGIAVHDGRHAAMADPGPGRRWHTTRAASAVTGAFLATRRDLFEAVGGFDETGLPVAYGDIDFALKLRARGYKILWTPSITLRHFESKTRGFDHLDPEKRARNAAEASVMQQRWGAALEAEPSVNPAWHSATLPFRLLSAPPATRLWRHIRLCASAAPWLIEPPAQQPAASCGSDVSRTG